MSKRTSTFALMAILFASGAGTAMAADLAPPPPPPPAPEIRPVASDWTGPYIGAVLGGTCMETRTRFDTYDAATGTRLETFPSDLNGCGFNGGFVTGFNYQMGDIVFGLEGDWTWGGKTGEHVAQHYTYATDPNTGQPVVTGRLDQEERYNIDWMASVRLRAGLLMSGNTLAYITGGPAWLKGELEDVRTGASFDNTHTGYTIGGGLEHALTENIHLRAEYMFASFKEKTYGRFCNDPATCTVAVDVTPKMSQFHTFRVGVSWNFPVSSW